MFKRILIAVDGSEPSKNALLTACDLATKYGADLHLVHSPQVETTTLVAGSAVVEIQPSEEDILEAGKGVISAAKATASEQGCDSLEFTIGNSDPAKDILECIDDVGADLVVMGRRGLGGLGSLFLGSVSQKVIHGAGCSCLTVT